MTSEVLPNLRKSGKYEVNFTNSQKDYQNPLEQSVNIPENVRSLHPHVRLKLWENALQSARLDNGGTQEALYWFEFLCQMMNEKKEMDSKEISLWANIFLISAPKSSGIQSLKLYNTFLTWFEKNYPQKPTASHKAFAKAMGNIFEIRHSNKTYILASFNNHAHEKAGVL